MFELINLFPTPVYVADVDIKFEDKDLEILKNLSYKRYPIDNGSHSEDLNVLNHPNFSLLRSGILNNFYDYLDYISVSKFEYDWYISSSWVNLHHPDDYSHRHFHTNAIFSGIYYVTVPENSGDTVFELDEMENRIALPSVKLKFFEPNMYNSEKALLPSKEGRLVLFPSRLRHSVVKNKSNKDRYVIAMNFFCRGDTSDGQNRLELK